MKNEILTKLDEIESERGITIHSARERGSRMMGVAHDDSDWDIMFVYSMEPWKYAAPGHSMKTITVSDEPLDLHGWNIDKFANHLLDSNPDAIEFLMADTYREDSSHLWEVLREDATENFNHMALYHHYISMAKKNYCKYIESGNDCTRGRQFYVMRATAYARYIRLEGHLPPMNVYDFLDEAHPHALSDEEHDKLMWLADQKSLGRGSEDQPDVVGEFYEAESSAPIEANKGRIRSPDRDLLIELVRESLR